MLVFAPLFAACGFLLVVGTRVGGGPPESALAESVLAKSALRDALAESCTACSLAVEEELGFALTGGWSADGGAQAYARFASRFSQLLRLSHRGLSASSASLTAGEDFERSAFAGGEMRRALDLRRGVAYSASGVCALLAACPTSFSPSVPTAHSVDSVRVTHAHAARGYAAVRVSRVTSQADAVTASSTWSYNEPFRYRWTDLRLATGLVTATPGAVTLVDVGDAVPVAIELPVAGAGALGVWIADPCYSSAYVVCALGHKFRVLERTPKLLNAALEGPAHRAAQYWAIWGDNFYDRDGALTTAFWARLSREAQQRLFMSVPGNHDYWVDGRPAEAQPEDQFGNGHMQFYAQDSVAAEASEPFDFRVDPDEALQRALNTSADAVADVSNFAWWHLIGDVGYAGLSAAYDASDVSPYLREACEWAHGRYAAGELSLFIVAGHWSGPGDGARPGATTPALFDSAASGALGAGCAALHDLGRLKFVEGHTHCNEPAQADGWIVAAHGMSGCGNYALAALDTTGGYATLLNFELVSADGLDNYDQIYDCVNANGIRNCAHLATVWLNQSLQR